MTRKLQLAVSGFTDGLNTEASALSILPSEMMDGSINIELMQNGSVRRRRGVDFIGESDAGGFLQALRTAALNDEAQQESPSAIAVKLSAPNGDLVERLVVDLDNKFYIYNITDGNTALVNIDDPAQTIDRGQQSNSAQKYTHMEFASSGDKLFFAGQHCNPGYLYVGADNTTIEIFYIDVLVRDPTATAVNSRVQLSSKWYECIEAHIASASNQPGSGADWTRYWFQLDGSIPTGIATWTSGTSYGTTFLKRYNKRNVAGSTDRYPSTVEFFAGRLWLSGDPKNPNSVYFSQVILAAGDVERFHQFADPFNTDDPDLVDDDGGIVSVQGAGATRRLIALSSSLFVCTTSGIWQINGQDGIFKATNYSVKLALTDGIDGPTNVVKVDKELIVFGQKGIWRALLNTDLTSSAAGTANFTSLDQDRVETYYANIPTANKARAWAVYNPSERRIYYFHTNNSSDFYTSYGSGNHPGYARHVLVLDARFDKTLVEGGTQQGGVKRNTNGAFFLYELADTAADEKPYISAPFIIPAGSITTENVTASGDTVTNSSLATVTADTNSATRDAVLFLALQRVLSGSNVTTNMAFARLAGNDCVDWSSDATYAASFTSRIKSGIQTMGDVFPTKSATYIFFVFKRVETGTLIDGVDTNPGGCYVRTAWNWSTSAVSNKYSAQTQVYVADRYSYALADGGNDGHDHVWYKHRVRGRGHSLGVIFESDGDKDFHLLGWTQQFHGKQE